MGAAVTVEETIDAKPETVFDIATKVGSWAEVIPAIEKIEFLTPGDEVEVGTRFRETRRMFGREATEEMEFLELERPTGYVLGAESHGCRYRTEFQLHPNGDGTRLRMVFHATPLTFGAKVMSFLMKPMMKKMGDLCAKDLAALKAHIEGGPAAG
ncbi:MAG: SRPBCC family protein [Planctomycetota bacterium]